jgi:hypothetical protein
MLRAGGRGKKEKGEENRAESAHGSREKRPEKKWSATVEAATIQRQSSVVS